MNFFAATLLLLAGLTQSTAVAHQSNNRENKTYEQVHQAARVSVKGKLRKSSEIGNECGFWSWAPPCTSSKNYCFIEEGQCGGETAYIGVCQAKPEVCTMQEDPVCGCDGKTYSNDCVANSNGVSVWHKGKCEEGTRCSPGTNPCTNLDSYFCKMDEGMCGQPLTTQRGSCTAYGTGYCAGVWSPVCGCDGKVYSNTCDAHVEGVNVSYELDPNDETNLPRGECEIKEETTDDRKERRSTEKREKREKGSEKREKREKRSENRKKRGEQREERREKRAASKSSTTSSSSRSEKTNASNADTVVTVE